ncbi:MAG TPA: hypothetical protein VN611_10545 [Patescibacteria group bacterium]|nr:hypothetical protein [Patescibacteria group bacterium]
MANKTSVAEVISGQTFFYCAGKDRWKAGPGLVMNEKQKLTIS